MFLKQSTAQTVRFGPFLDSTDGITAETGLTIAQADMQLSKDGGAFSQKNVTGNATHDADGWYSTSLNTTDTATVGELLLQVTVSGALPVWTRWYVVEEAIYDALFATSANIFTGAAGSSQLTDIAANVVDSGVIATDAIGADAIATDAITAAKIAADAIGASELAAGAVNEIRDAILADSTPFDGANIDAAISSRSTVTTAQVNAQADLALSDAGVNSTRMGYVDNINGHTPQTGDTYELANGATGFVAIDTVVDAVKAVTDALPNSGALTDIAANVAAILLDTADMQPKLGTPNTDVSADIAAVKAETVLIVADTNELQSDWVNGGRLDLILDTRASQTTADAIETDTQDIQSKIGTPTADLAADIATVDSNVDAILVDTGTTIPALITALNDISVSDVLTTQMTEAYAADGVAPTLAQALFLIQQSIGDFSISGTTLTVKEIDGSTTAATYTLDDASDPTSRTRAT